MGMTGKQETEKEMHESPATSPSPGPKPSRRKVAVYSQQWRLPPDVIDNHRERIKILPTKEASFPSSLSSFTPFLSTFFFLPPSRMPETHMAFHKIVAATAAGAFFLFLYCVVFSPTLYSNGNRRNLHEPLYPIQWTPPSPPSEDTSPIPEVSTPPAPSTDSPSPPATAVQTASPIAASTTNSHSLSTFAKLAIGVSASVCVVAILSISAYFLTRRRATTPPESRKLIGDSRLFPPPDRQIAVSDFLYLGTMEPAVPPAQRLSDASNDSPYRKLGAEIVEVCHPSPELQPLPPLAGRDVPPAPPPLDGTTATGSSDEDDTFYTSKLSVASRNSESSGSPRSRRCPHTFLAGKDVPMSRRTSPRKQLSEYSPSEVKHAISPHHPPSPPPPPPPPPIPLPAFKKEESVKLPPFFIKTPIFGTTNRDLHEVPSSPVPSSRRQLLRPLPPEDAARARVRSPIVPLVNDGCTSSSPPIYETEDDLSNEVKPTLKPLHWEKVQGSIGREMVWDQLKSDSFPLNEDMIETLFVNNSAVPSLKEQSRRTVHLPPLKQEYRVLDPKKSQNIAILLRALNVTREEVSEALLDGNTDGLGAELFETLMKMAPTKEEELKLRDYNGDTSKLGSAERFLKAILSIPYAFKRVDVMLYRANFEAEVKYLWSSFETLEAACEDLKNSKLFMKLLEAVLRTGIRMNVGTNRSESKAFKLDTLLKLADVKGSDRKTTILHFVVQEITRTEGLVSESAAENQQGLKAVACLSTELGNVKKAAGMDPIVLNSYLSKLVHGLENIRSVLQLGDSCEQGQKFFDNTRTFLQEAEQEIGRVKSKEKKALNRIRELTEYFHGDVGKEEAHPLRIFMVVRDFLAVLDNVCKDVGRLHERAITSSAKSFRVSESLSLPVLHRFVPKPTTSVSNEASSSP